MSQPNQTQVGPMLVRGYVLIDPPPPPPAKEPQPQQTTLGFIPALLAAAALILGYWFLTGGYATLQR